MRDEPHDHWYEKSSMKTRARVFVDPQDLKEGKQPFSQEQVPAVRHPVFLDKAGPDAVPGMLTRALFTWLSFTEYLELHAVNPVASAIATGGIPVGSPDLEFRANQIVTDEAGHAQVAKDIIRQMSAATGVPYQRLGLPLFFERLGRVKAGLSADLAGLADLSFTVVSETLISGNLAELPKDLSVVSAVREIALDHARDEAGHRNYFISFFEEYWPCLDASIRMEMGPALPELILAFVEPDLNLLGAQLRQCPGLSDENVKQILTETYPAERRAANARSTAAVTLKLFQRAGVYDDPRTADAFRGRGLIP